MGFLGGTRGGRYVVSECTYLAGSSLSEALMEYHCGNKDVTVASRIFERGMELFGDQLEYVLHYLNFLISINDENSE